MKRIILILTLFASLFFFSEVCRAKEDPRPKQIKIAKNIKSTTIMSSSYLSYEEAMNRLHYMKPDGYMIESIRYFRNGKSFYVLAKIRKF